MSPLVVVGGESHVLVAVEKDTRGGGFWAVHENEVVGFEYFFGDVSRWNDERGDLLQLQQHERAMLVREGLEGTVRQHAKLMKISDEGYLRCGNVPSWKITEIKNWNRPLAGRLHHCLCKNWQEAARLHLKKKEGKTGLWEDDFTFNVVLPSDDTTHFYN